MKEAELLTRDEMLTETRKLVDNSKEIGDLLKKVNSATSCMHSTIKDLTSSMGGS